MVVELGAANQEKLILKRAKNNQLYYRNELYELFFRTITSMISEFKSELIITGKEGRKPRKFYQGRIM